MLVILYEKMDEVIQWLGKKELKSQLSRYSKYRGYIEEFIEMEILIVLLI